MSFHSYTDCFCTFVLGGSDEESDPEEDEDDVPEMFTNGDLNSQLTVGYKNDRSYVLRGNTLGVFSHTNDDQVKYYNSIKKISTPKGKEFKPKHVIMAFLTPNNSQTYVPGYIDHVA